MNNLPTFFEQFLQEATAFEVYNQAFATKLSPDTFLSILKIDPTASVQEASNVEDTLAMSKKGAYTDWVIRQYTRTNGGAAKARFLGEDAEQIRQYLDIYKALTQNKEGLAKLTRSLALARIVVANVKDLNQFTLATLTTVVTPFLNKDVKSLGSKNEDKIRLVYEDDTWQVVVPLTHSASRKYGTGTHWCTATANDSYFRSYSEDGPLCIIKAKKLPSPDNKWQYHKPSNQFMDYLDDSLSVRRFLLRFLNNAETIEQTKKMAAEISKVSGSKAWDPSKFESDSFVDITNMKRAITQAGGDVDDALIGKTPIVIAACKSGSTDMLDILLNNYHADPVVYDSKGSSALATAILAKNVDAVKMLLKAGSPEMMLAQREAGGSTILHKVAASGDLSMLYTILERLTSEASKISYLNARDNLRRTPLMLAISESRTEQAALDIVKIIIESMEGKPSALVESIIRRILEDDEEIIPVKKHLVDLRDSSGRTAIVYAFAKGYDAVVDYLLEHGAHLEAAQPKSYEKVLLDSNSKQESLKNFVLKNKIDSPMLQSMLPTTGLLREIGSLGDTAKLGLDNFPSVELSKAIVYTVDVLLSRVSPSKRNPMIIDILGVAYTHANILLFKYLFNTLSLRDRALYLTADEMIIMYIMHNNSYPVEYLKDIIPYLIEHGAKIPADFNILRCTDPTSSLYLFEMLLASSPKALKADIDDGFFHSLVRRLMGLRRKDANDSDYFDDSPTISQHYGKDLSGKERDLFSLAEAAYKISPNSINDKDYNPFLGCFDGIPFLALDFAKWLGDHGAKTNVIDKDGNNVFNTIVSSFESQMTNRDNTAQTQAMGAMKFVYDTYPETHNLINKDPILETLLEIVENGRPEGIKDEPIFIEWVDLVRSWGGMTTAEIKSKTSGVPIGPRSKAITYDKIRPTMGQGATEDDTMVDDEEIEIPMADQPRRR